jgi:hypothetical protein
MEVKYKNDFRLDSTNLLLCKLEEAKKNLERHRNSPKYKAWMGNYLVQENGLLKRIEAIQSELNYREELNTRKAA